MDNPRFQCGESSIRPPLGARFQYPNDDELQLLLEENQGVLDHYKFDWRDHLVHVLDRVATAPMLPDGRVYEAVYPDQQAVACAWSASLWPPPPGHLMIPPVYLNGDQRMGGYERVRVEYQYRVCLGEHDGYEERGVAERFAAAELFRPGGWERARVGQVFYEELWIPIIHDAAPRGRGRQPARRRAVERERYSLLRYRRDRGEDGPETLDWYPATEEYSMTDRQDVQAWLNKASFHCLGPNDNLYPFRNKRLSRRPVYSLHPGVDIDAIDNDEHFLYVTFLSMMHFVYKGILQKVDDFSPANLRYRHDVVNSPQAPAGWFVLNPLAPHNMRPQLRNDNDRHYVESNLYHHLRTALLASNLNPWTTPGERRLRYRREEDGTITDMTAMINARGTEYEEFLEGYSIYESLHG